MPAAQESATGGANRVSQVLPPREHWKIHLIRAPRRLQAPLVQKVVRPDRTLDSILANECTSSREAVPFPSIPDLEAMGQPLPKGNTQRALVPTPIPAPMPLEACSVALVLRVEAATVPICRVMHLSGRCLCKLVRVIVLRSAIPYQTKRNPRHTYPHRFVMLKRHRV